MPKHTHTPGPWIVARGDTVYAPRGEGLSLAPIADCAASRTVTNANRAANARLIAAAPDLLASNGLLVACLHDAIASARVRAATYRHLTAARDHDTNIGLAAEVDRNADLWESALVEARAAIAKATGGDR